MKCTVHSARELVPAETQFGIRWECPVGGCTVVLWDGSTSTPADYATRQARIEAHEHFDRLWKSGVFSRNRAYRKLAKYLGLPKRKAHIGHFNIALCQRTIDFCRAHTGLRMELNVDEDKL